MADLDLAQQLSLFWEEGYLKDVMPEIMENLNPNMELRPYQRQAFSQFDEFMNKPKYNNGKFNALFHMATGSGKTLIMSGLMLYLYKRGYRNFIFFVNSTNIVEKTKLNFTGKGTSKYLFADNIIIDNKKVNIKAVDNFYDSDKDSINILFTTIQGLHLDLNFPKENSVTYDELANNKVVLIADEAHHINADTKKAGKKNGKMTADEMDAYTWENTIKNIFDGNSDNVLLEFTATMGLSDEAIRKKYKNKMVIDYDLKKFRNDKYSKDVKVIQIENIPLKRALLAMVISQFRQKIFAKYNKYVKPVVLFKSLKIKDSVEFYNEFIEVVKNLTVQDLEEIIAYRELNITSSISTEEIPLLDKIKNFFDENNVSLDNLLLEIKDAFKAENLLVVNSDNECDSNQILLNSLEDADNPIRGIFAVDKLNEGWDVLNLFDIVRLYEGRSIVNGKPGPIVTKEAQLIGRGARYFPFQIEEYQEKYKRKYDDDINNELRICEELFYYSQYNPQYIQELTKVLKQQGIMADNSIKIELKLKKSFKNTWLYKNGFIYVNKRVRRINETLEDVPRDIIKEYYVNLPTSIIQEKSVFNEDDVFEPQIAKNTKTVMFKDFNYNVLTKALRQKAIFRFDNIKNIVNGVKSSRDFLLGEKHLGKVKINISGRFNEFSDLTMEQQLYVASNVLEQVANSLNGVDKLYQGTTTFEPVMVKNAFKDKTLIRNRIDVDGDGVAQSKVMRSDLYMQLPVEDWYAYEDNFGTTEEKLFVRSFAGVVDKFKAKYENVYLLRNEKAFAIYSFLNNENLGSAFEPDYVLCLQNGKGKNVQGYQVFIEPKGTNLLQTDEWKEEFLLALKNYPQEKVSTLYEDEKIKIWGLPFYNHDFKSDEFSVAIDELI